MQRFPPDATVYALIVLLFSSMTLSFGYAFAAWLLRDIRFLGSSLWLLALCLLSLLQLIRKTNK